MKRYNYQEFKNDPRTYPKEPGIALPRLTQALFNCIDNKKTSPEELFTEIDKLYSLYGKPRNSRYIKKAKQKALKLLNQMDF